MAKVPLVHTRAATYNISTTNYNGVATGRMQPDTNEDRRYVLFREAGTFSQLYVNVSANTITADSSVTLRKNATTDTALAVTIGSSATGIFEDTADTVASAAGDKWSTKVTTGGTGTSIAIRTISYLFAATTDTSSRFVFYGNSTTQTTTTYFALVGTASAGDATESNVKNRIRQSGTIKNLYVRIRSNSKAGNSPIKFRKNGADAGPTVTVGSSATGDFEDTSNTTTVAAGDDASISWAFTVAGTIIPQITSIALETTDSKGWIQASAMEVLTVGEPLTRYFHVGGGYDNGISTESQAQMRTREAFTFSQLTIHISANTVNASEFRFRKNAADGNQLCSIGASATGYVTDSTNTDVCDNNDDINYSLVTPATGGTQSLTVRSVGVTVTPGINAVTKTMPTETITISEAGLARLNTKNRSFATETISITESGGTPTRLTAKLRPIAAQTVTISENVASVKARQVTKSLATETVTISESSITRLTTKQRALTAETTTITDGVTRTLAGGQEVTRALPVETVTILDYVDWTHAEIVPITEQVVSRTVGRVRPLATETVTVGGGTLARLAAKSRPIAAQTVTMGESAARLKASMRAIATQTVTVGGGTLARIKGAVKPLAAQTVTAGETLARLLAKTRAIPSQTVTIGETAARLTAKMRALATQTITIGDSVSQALGTREIIRALATETVAVSESLAKLLAKSRAIVQTVPTSENAARIKGASRTIPETVGKAEQIARIKGSVKSLALQTVTISSGSVTRLAAKIRSLSQNITIAESVVIEITGEIVKQILETVAITENVARIVSKNKSIATQTTTIGESLARIKGKTQALAVQTVIVSDSIVRRLAKQRILPETLPIPETLQRLTTKARALAIGPESLAVADSVSQQINIVIKHIIRTLSETVQILDTVFIKEISKFRLRHRRIVDPSKPQKIRSNHPAYLLGTRGQHDNYIEF